MSQETAKFLDAAWWAADSAGTLIRESWLQPKEIDYKGAIDLVTSIDRESERKIVEIIRGHFPDHSILAEEETDHLGARNQYRWIIDPLDGTTNFVHSYPQFAISIALERDGEVILGLVYDPLRRECFRALRGEGATLNGNPIRVSTVAKLNDALLATGFPYDRRENADYYLTFFKAFLTRSQGIRRAGAAALDLCYLACGRIDGFWELKLRPWDVAAGTLIVAESGGRLSNLSGNEFSIRGSETLASNSVIHEEMLKVATAARHQASRLQTNL